jgi:hypothetical protein
MKNRLHPKLEDSNINYYISENILILLILCSSYYSMETANSGLVSFGSLGLSEETSISKLLASDRRQMRRR